MPISPLDLMEFFEQVFGPQAGTPRPAADPAPDSFFTAPEDTPTRTLQDLLGTRPGLLLAAAETWEGEGKRDLAATARQIARFLEERGDEMNTPETRIQRLGAYVYPVV